MGFLNGSKKKYLALLPIVFLLLNAVYFQQASVNIEETLLQHKYIEAVDHIDMLAAAVEADTSRYWEDHEKHIRDSIGFIDSLHLTFAAAYKPVDDEWKLISARDYAANFDPFMYEEFTAEIAKHDTGSINLGFQPDNGPRHIMRLYFKKTPMYAPPGHRYLLVAAVSRYSVDTRIPAWVSAGQWASTLVTFVLNVWLILMIARIGTIYKEHKSEMAGGDRVV